EPPAAANLYSFVRSRIIREPVRRLSHWPLSRLRRGGLHSTRSERPNGRSCGYPPGSLLLHGPILQLRTRMGRGVIGNFRGFFATKDGGTPGFSSSGPVGRPPVSLARPGAAAAKPGRGNGAVVTEDLQSEQPVVQRGAGGAPGEQGCTRGV